eukprot:GHVN01106880.1.p1 GENE.GHVN01106880.1~~GHVN01106880.1.p1  ORF type:complete len:348 (-),score=114.52 GHVN01106880.1:112-1155(-)
MRRLRRNLLAAPLHTRRSHQSASLSQSLRSVSHFTSLSSPSQHNNFSQINQSEWVCSNLTQTRANASSPHSHSPNPPHSVGEQQVKLSCESGGLSGERGSTASGERGSAVSGESEGLRGERGGVVSGERGGVVSGERGDVVGGQRGGVVSGERGGAVSEATSQPPQMPYQQFRETIDKDPKLLFTETFFKRAEESEAEQAAQSGESDEKYRAKGELPTMNRKMESWEEVDKNHPMAPHGDDFEWPSDAPDPKRLSRAQIENFMMGSKRRFSSEFLGFMVISLGWTWILFSSLLTAYFLAPADFSWVEKERVRLKAAKVKMERVLAQRKAQEEATKASRGGGTQVQPG